MASLTGGAPPGAGEGLPFWGAGPDAIGGRGWALILIAVAVAFVALTILPAETFPATLVPALLFAGIPLLALRHVAGSRWTRLFRAVGLKQLGQMVLFGCLTIVVSMAVALVLNRFGLLTPNPISADMATMSGTDFVLRLVPTLPQLLGEELLTILPLLAILWFVTARLGLGRRAGMAVAIVGSSLLFAAAHLPTYDWHVAQCLGVIGLARVVLTLSYLWTRNLWVSTGGHVFNDWSEFTLGFVTSHVPVGTG